MIYIYIYDRHGTRHGIPRSHKSSVLFSCHTFHHLIFHLYKAMLSMLSVVLRILRNSFEGVGTLLAPYIQVSPTHHPAKKCVYGMRIHRDGNMHEDIRRHVDPQKRAPLVPSVFGRPSIAAPTPRSAPKTTPQSLRPGDELAQATLELLKGEQEKRFGAARGRWGGGVEWSETSVEPFSFSDRLGEPNKQPSVLEWGHSPFSKR